MFSCKFTSYFQNIFSYMKIQRGELTNILLWLKNMYTWLTQKHRNVFGTFKCQKTFWNITLAIKASLRVEYRTQYKNHQMNNTVKNQICPKKSRYISLDSLFDMIVQNDSLAVTKTCIAKTWEKNRYAKQLTSLGI